MSVTVTKLPGSRVEIQGELGAEAFEHYIKKTTVKIVADTEIDGFRKGKAPEKLVLEKMGEDRLLHQSAEAALQAEWPKVLEENNIEAIGQAEFHILKIARGNALAWKAAVAVLPEITLPDYKGVAKSVNAKKEIPAIEVTDKEVDETLAYIQKVRAPKDSSPPPLDDAYARAIGNFPDLQALKNNIRDGIVAEKETKAREEHRKKIVEGIEKGCSVEIPEVMILAEQGKMLQEFQANIQDMGLKWDDYLAHMKKTEEELKKDWAADAVKRVRIGLMVDAVAQREKIEPREDEIFEHVERILQLYTDEDRKNIDPDRIRDYAYSIVRNEKVLEFLETR